MGARQWHSHRRKSFVIYINPTFVLIILTLPQTEFSPFLYTNLYWNLKPLVVLFVDQSKTADATEHIKMLEEVCTEFKGKVHCTYANG